MSASEPTDPGPRVPHRPSGSDAEHETGASHGDPVGTNGRALVIGAGPAGLIAAEMLAEAGVSVVVADQMPSPAR